LLIVREDEPSDKAFLLQASWRILSKN